MNSFDSNTHLMEMRYRTERAERRATLMSQIGTLPKAEKLRLFSRRVVSLAAPIEIRHGPSADSAQSLPQRAA